MKSQLNTKLAGYGQWTYRGAWALELVAATIGLATGLALGIQAFQTSQSVTAVDLALASAPFFMVAIAELTKIPIATLLFSASWVWKPVVLAFLLILAGITFETVFMGLERAGALRQLRYEELVNKIESLRAETANLSAAIEEEKSTNFVANAQERLQQLSSSAASEREAITLQVADIDKQISAQTSLTPEATLARDQLAEREDRRNKLIAERDAELQTAMASFERQRDSYVERIENARTAGDRTAVRRYERELRELTSPRLAILERFRGRLEALEAEIAQQSATYDRLRATGNPMSDQERKVLQDRRADLQNLLQTTAEGWNRQLETARADLAKAQTREAEKDEREAGVRRRQSAIAEELNALEAERIPMARTDQVRRIASRVYGVRPEDVAKDQEGLIAVIWFSSLALIAALAGPITAMVALGLQRIAERDERPHPLARLLRRILLSWRWKRVRTVPFRVEVPVDREVEKIVDREVEKVVKEILYVPVLTDDPDAIRSALQRELPPEVADLVSMTAKGGPRARKA